MASIQALSALLKCNTALSLRLKAPSILFVFMTILAFDSPRVHRPCKRPLKGAVPPATAGFIHAADSPASREPLLGGRVAFAAVSPAEAWDKTGLLSARRNEMISVSKLSEIGLRKLILACAVAGFSAAALAGCNTVEGAGEDIESTGDAIQDSADD